MLVYVLKTRYATDTTAALTDARVKQRYLLSVPLFLYALQRIYLLDLTIFLH